MDTGETALAFAGLEAAEFNGLTLRPNTAQEISAGWEICLVTSDVDTAYDRAVEAGCQSVSAPSKKPWGQTVAYVRDLNGCLVEIASPVSRG